MGVLTMIQILKTPHSPSKSCHNMAKEESESSYPQLKEMNKIKNTKNERFSKPKAPSCSTGASKKLCLCAPATHPGSFKCRFHRTTTKSHKSAESETRISSPARLVLGAKYRKSLNHSKRMVTPLPDKVAESGILTKYRKDLNSPKQAHGGRVKSSNKANVHGQPRLSRFGRAALAAAATSNIQIQPISAALREMSIG